MIIIYLILLWHLVCTGWTLDHSPLSLHHVKLGIVENEKVIKHVNLKQTWRVLANKHLPVWTLSGTIDDNSISNTDGHELKRDYEVMKQLGGFTFYQEPETSSSAVYFHKRREFDGLIGDEFFIFKLSIDNINPTKETLLPLNEVGVYRKSNYEDHTYEPEVTDTDPEAGVNDQGGNLVHKDRSYNGYPEILVIIAWDLAEEWTQDVDESDWRTTIVSNVLTLFNGVDMLYSKLKHTKIQINIAGIIIETVQESLYFLKSCYLHDVQSPDHYTYKLEGHCVNRAFSHFLSARKNKIPLDSYDMAIFLTGEYLFTVKKNVAGSGNRKFKHVIGIALRPENLYEARKVDAEWVLTGTVTTDEYFQNYPSLAHEIAHLMTVRHDESQYVTCDRKKCGHIMKVSGKWCDTCLSWSETSEKTFTFFFRSPNCCAFINIPRSLSPPRRRLILTADEQCNCYGYASALLRKKFWSGDMPEDFCRTVLQCKDESNKFQPTVIPMDGTPCGKDKVCWERKCQVTQTFAQSLQSNGDKNI